MAISLADLADSAPSKMMLSTGLYETLIIPPYH